MTVISTVTSSASTEPYNKPHNCSVLAGVTAYHDVTTSQRLNLCQIMYKYFRFISKNIFIFVRGLVF